MVYNYRVGVIVPFMQKYYKQLAFAVAAIFLATVMASSLNTNAAVTSWDQGFETDTAGWVDGGSYGLITRTATGTNGVTSSEGSWHAVATEVVSGPYTRFGGYSDSWPGTWTTETDVYLDTAWANGSGFEYSVAANGSNNAHRRDFVFHVTKDSDLGQLLVSGDNNAGFAPSESLESGTHGVIATSGWYTLQHVFKDVAGVLAVDMNVLDSNGVVVFTTTRSDASDLIPSIVGGNRYGWFTDVTVTGGLNIDNSVLVLDDVTQNEINVYGNTGVENQKGAWMFNRDPRTSTAYEFVAGTGTLGAGSVYAGPITNTNFSGVVTVPANSPDRDKFIAEYFARDSVANFRSLSYDFKIAGDGVPADANQFYANFYVTLTDGTTFRDCRFDFIPTTGSVGAFTTFTITKNTVGVNGGGASCPASMKLADMTAGSYIRDIAINVGDTSANDTGLAGYIDNVVYSVNGTNTVYDFEPKPTYTVTIDKYVDDIKATATNANNTAFPMVATWSAENGAGSGNYDLDVDGFNGNTTPYQAITANMTMGANYTTNEILGTTVATTCVGGGAPFRLVGYTTGNSSQEAQTGTPSATIPSFTNLQENKFVIVWNEKCVFVTKADECKNGGWANGLADGRTFKNQGDCVSYFASKMKNQPANTTTTTNRR